MTTSGSIGALWTGLQMQANLLIALNFALALLLGVLVGYERAYHGRAAGMRTYGLVCMVSAAIVSIAAHPGLWFGGNAIGAAAGDPTRVMQGIVTGVGFLGAGAIMKEGFNISGLTTAASIWAAAAIGILVGVGFHLAAILLTLLSASCLAWVSRIEHWLPSHSETVVKLRFAKGPSPDAPAFIARARESGFEIMSNSLSINVADGQPEWQFVAVALDRNSKGTVPGLERMLSAHGGVESFQITPMRN